MANRIVTSISIREDLKKRAEQTVEKGEFPGVTSLSGLVEYALEKILEKTKEG